MNKREGMIEKFEEALISESTCNLNEEELNIFNTYSEIESVKELGRDIYIIAREHGASCIAESMEKEFNI